MSDRFLTVEQLLALLDKYFHKELHVHHTWLPNHSHFNGSNHQRMQDGMRNHHVKTNGWVDIGQHITVFPDGRILTGRDFGRNPASITGFNTGAFCIENVGDFDIGKDKLEGKQLSSLLAIAKYFYDKKRYIRFHNENSGKTCPGSSVNKNVFMEQVKNYGKKESVPVNKNAFPDVGTNHSAYEAVEELKKLGILNGFPDGTYRPNETLTRGQFAIGLYNAIKHLKK